MPSLRFLACLLAACASPAPRAPATVAVPSAVATTSTPCFPGDPPLRASDLYTTLEPYAQSLYLPEDAPPPPVGTFGTCRVERNVVRAVDGSTVAELGCGVRVLKRGILDDLGLEIGATGQQVLDRKPRPQTPLVCFPNGADQVRCSFERAEDNDTDGTAYVVNGAIEEPLTGAAAIAHFAPRTIIELHTSVWCH